MEEPDDTYPSGPDVSEHFPLVQDPDVPLPLDFDTTCKCGKELERIYPICKTRRRPFATFACESCGHRLYLFEAPRVPLILSQQDFPRSSDNHVSLESACFSEFIELLIEKREEKYRRNQARAQNA